MTMETTTKVTDNDRLLAWMGTIPNRVLSEVRAQIIEECHITRFILVNWLTGRTRIPELAKEKIEKIAQQKIFEE